MQRGQAHRARHSLEMGEHLVLGQRHVGERRQQHRIRPRRLRILANPMASSVRSAPIPTMTGGLAVRLGHRRLDHSPPLVPRQIGVGAGAAEQPDGIHLRRH